MSFTTSDIKKLREMTGAGMMACKEALKESSGSLTDAVDFLRKKGLADAKKKQSRIASEGTIATVIDGRRGVVLEVNCETDFVSKGEDFQAFATSTAQYILQENIEDIDALKESQKSRVHELTLKCGEKIDIRRFNTLNISKGVLGVYNHGGRIGALVALETSSDNIENLGRELAMHIAACDPKFIEAQDIDEDFKKKEAEIYAAQLKEQGKPENMVDKIVQGKLKKLATEVCLLEQKFVKDQHKTVRQYIKEFGEVKVLGLVKMNLGEGLEKREESLADEVAKIRKH